MTAYEMRISDWSSDVCSSDLAAIFAMVTTAGSKTEIRRVTIVWIAETISQATGIGSIESWGIEAWPPAPLTMIERTSDEASSGPARPAKTPCGALGMMWSAKAASGSGSINPSSSMKRSEEHTSELQSLMRISYAVFCLKKKKKQ